MASSTVTRRPLPALIALVALLLLTVLVWWRVLHRDTGSPHAAAPPCPSPSSTPPPTAPALPAPNTVTVQVLNSTNRPGIAGQAQAALSKDGFRSAGPAANDLPHHNKIKGVAQIRFRGSSRPAARLLRYYFPGARLVRIHRRRSVVTVSLGKRYRRVASAGQVSAALRADGISTSPAPSPTTSRSGC